MLGEYGQVWAQADRAGPAWLMPRKRYAFGRCFGGFCIVKASGRMPRSSSRQLTGATIGKPGSARGE